MEVLNFIIVTLYGNNIMLFFTDANKSKLQLFGLLPLYIFSGVLNLVLWKFLKAEVLYMLYPFTVHLPLLLYYIFALKTPSCRALFALTAAYMLTTPRKWLCVLAKHFLGDGIFLSSAAEVLISAVLLILIYRYAAPVVNKVFKSNPREADRLCILPSAVYIITYATTVYSDFLFRFPMITIPVLTTVLTVFFVGFEIYFFDYTLERASIHHEKEMFDLQIRSIERLATHIKGEDVFCENKTVNSFLSMYKAAAKGKGVEFICRCSVSPDINTLETVAVLTDAVEAALESAEKYIEIEVLQKKGQICIMIKTDAAPIYDESVNSMLSIAVGKSGGLIYMDENNYKIQISIKK